MRMEIAVKAYIDKRKYEEDDFEHHIISTDKPRQPACYTSVAHKKAYQNNEKRQNGNVCSYLKIEAQCVESTKQTAKSNLTMKKILTITSVCFSISVSFAAK